MPDSDVLFLSAAHGSLARLLGSFIGTSAAPSGVLTAEDAAELSKALGATVGARIYPDSIACTGNALYAAAKDSKSRRLVVRASVAKDSRGTDAYTLDARPWTESVAETMRDRLRFLRPGPIGQGASIGLGDRTGCATAGHARAMRSAGMTPAFAQQSAREMKRTGRSAREVLDDACWGVFVAGWRRPWGADADHLKEPADIDACAAAGFTMFTLDLGDFVDDAASTDSHDVLRHKFERLPWTELGTSPEDCRRGHIGHSTGADEESFLRAAVKYGKAVARAAKLAQHVASRMGRRPYELEISLDECSTPTTPFEHRFVSSELARMGVRPASVAVRLIGNFEKGIDYKGELDQLARAIESHVEVARELGPYKLSVHSGSDKFSLYPILARSTGGTFHLKTSGTSWLEALRTLAEAEFELFCEIVSAARAHYDADRKTYQVSATSEALPEKITKEQALALLDEPSARQVLHVTYGAVLGGKPQEAIRNALEKHEELYWSNLKRCIDKHLRLLSSIA